MNNMKLEKFICNISPSGVYVKEYIPNYKMEYVSTSTLEFRNYQLTIYGYFSMSNDIIIADMNFNANNPLTIMSKLSEMKALVREYKLNEILCHKKL